MNVVQTNAADTERHVDCPKESTLIAEIDTLIAQSVALIAQSVAELCATLTFEACARWLTMCTGE